jgi:rubredoxin
METLLLQDRETFYANEKADGKKLFTSFKKNHSYIGKPVQTELALPKFYLPYYEGFNKVDNNYWLGIYRRDEMFPVSFLMDVCDICLETKIGQLYTTPWKSIIVKGIEHTNRILWDHVLGKYRINVRHAANELNWQVGDTGEEGLILKRHIVRHFDKEDVRTYGLSFAIQIYASSSMFGSVIIRKQQTKNPHKLKSLERFDILYNPDFNPNSGELIIYRDSVEKDHIGTYLISLCKLFYEQESKRHLLQHVSTQTTQHNVTVKSVKILHQCKHCFTVYDEQEGVAENKIEPGPTFYDLPASYRCPLCDGDKKDFIEVEESSLMMAV